MLVIAGILAIAGLFWLLYWACTAPADAGIYHGEDDV